MAIKAVGEYASGGWHWFSDDPNEKPNPPEPPEKLGRWVYHPIKLETLKMVYTLAILATDDFVQAWRKVREYALGGWRWESEDPNEKPFPPEPPDYVPGLDPIP